MQCVECEGGVSYLCDDESDLGLRQMGGVRRRKLGHTGKARQDKTRQAIARQENEDDVRWVGYDEGYWDTLARQGKTDKRWEETKEEEVENDDDVRWVGYDEGYWDTLARQDMTRQGMKKKTKEKEEFENEDDVG